MVETLLDNESGQSLLEYALLIALVGVAVIVVLALFGSDLGTLYQNIVAALQAALDPS